MTLVPIICVAGLIGTGQVPDSTSKRPGGYLMDFKIVAVGDRGDAVEKPVAIARSLDQWNVLRTKLGVSDESYATQLKLHGPLGAMDWGREQVVVAKSQQQRSGGYELSIQRVTRFTDSWRVDLLLQPPPKDMLTTQAMTTPYVAFRTRRTTGDPTIVVHLGQPK